MGSAIERTELGATRQTAPGPRPPSVQLLGSNWGVTPPQIRLGVALRRLVLRGGHPGAVPGGPAFLLSWIFITKPNAGQWQADGRAAGGVVAWSVLQQLGAQRAPPVGIASSSKFPVPLPASLVFVLRLSAAASRARGASRGSALLVVESGAHAMRATHA